jgi:hypothetical protein
VGLFSSSFPILYLKADAIKPDEKTKYTQQKDIKARNFEKARKWRLHDAMPL